MVQRTAAGRAGAHSIDSTRHLSIELIWCNSLSLLFLSSFNTHAHIHIYTRAPSLSLRAALYPTNTARKIVRETLCRQKKKRDGIGLNFHVAQPAGPTTVRVTHKKRKKGEQNRLAFLLRERERINRRRGRIILSKRYIYCRIITFVWSDWWD